MWTGHEPSGVATTPLDVLVEMLGLDFGYLRMANARGGPRISAADSRPSAGVIPTNEELMIARHTQHLL